MSDQTLAAMMLAALLVGIFSGYPVALVLAGIGIVFAVLGDVPLLFLSLGVGRIFTGILSNWLLVAIPLFVLMGLILERSGIAERLLSSLSSVFGGLPGSYGFAVAIIGIVLAAATGIIGASVVLMAMLALPAMRAAGYDMRLGSGLVAASGTLGILIPPSIMLIVLGDQMQVSVGDLFAAALVPGVLLGLAYLAYVGIVALVRPDLVPAVANPSSTNPARAWRRVCRDLLIPLGLIILVLGSIIVGLATPTESAAFGAAGAMVLAIANRGLSWKHLRNAIFETVHTTAMIVFVMIGASVFSLVFRRLGGDALIEDVFLRFGWEPWLVILKIMLIIFLLGFFLDWVEIVLVAIPLMLPVVVSLDVGLPREHLLIWFAIAVSINLQTSFLTPPFGYALFYLRGAAPDIPIATIYRGIVPFVALQLTMLAVVLVFPSLTLWLPLLLRGQ